jgi:ABC-type multidrug transport system permease subunit
VIRICSPSILVFALLGAFLVFGLIAVQLRLRARHQSDDDIEWGDWLLIGFFTLALFSLVAYFTYTFFVWGGC